MGRDQLEADVSLRPILIRKGALGNDRDLLVSRQHGMLIGDDHLVRAIHLAENTKNIRIAHGKREVTYIHLMFDAHQIIYAECVPSESLEMQFPQLKGIESIADAETRYSPLARPFAKKKQVKTLMHAANPQKRPRRDTFPEDIAVFNPQSRAMGRRNISAGPP